MYLHFWLAAQKLIGGTYGKQRLALSHYPGGSVLEIGCSVGNVSEAFAGRTNDFLGQDIDERALQIANKRLDTLKFTSEPLEALNRKFDYVMIAGVLHHVDRATSLELVRQAKRLAGPNATIMSYDPLPVHPNASIPRKIIGGMEAGRFLRPLNELVSLYEESGIPVSNSYVYPLPAWKTTIPEIFDLGVVVAKQP
ncbi:bifunctional 2-polyprenyl-6-hydroxyphenol methylase/3-demethylubiquinol 3-O-methyltransferase UbiG [Bradyrhizobium sp. PRIMUS42]|uniref:class I SAM-dependent methyltransferase n=1 Tax=Bradyrhizobium sp. PRIMUS42 TaxID=2908926 RepID=UPI001FF6905D|nr:class I SAM-dependent methyltransferase [Bradyrhizobium sp. PRIMUS42]MCJ9729397.1 methyltransferase [Bradyrhizobium sp. PRIMUS42]